MGEEAQNNQVVVTTLRERLDSFLEFPSMERLEEFHQTRYEAKIGSGCAVDQLKLMSGIAKGRIGCWGCPFQEQCGYLHGSVRDEDLGIATLVMFQLREYIDSLDCKS